MLSTRRAGQVGAVVLGGAAFFQLGLAAGAPWGAAAWGGQHKGRLPTSLRVASTASAVVLGAVAGIAASPAAARGRTGTLVLRVAAGNLAVGAPLNAVSRSRVERTWAPVNALGAVMLWRAAQPR